MATTLRCALRAALAMLCLVLTGPAVAHKSSDAYLQISAAPGQLALRWDIALRDLDVALDLDADTDGKLTWGEVRSAWPRIEAYASAHLGIDGCALKAGERALERRNDGAYAVLNFSAACTLATPPRIAYSLFADVDPTHRGIVRLQRAGAEVQVSVLEPRPRQAASVAAAASSPADVEPPSRWAFIGEGIHHILTGYDHVLFLLCLLLPSVMRRTPAGWQPVERLSQALWPVVGIVTAFTVGHSVTLALAALKVVSLSASFIEPAIAVTIALAALDNLRPVFPVRRIVVTFFFGLIHGFGFASVLGELDLPRAAFAWALLQFNVGLELGQVGVVAVVATLLFLARRWTGYARVVIGGGSLLAILVAVLWFIERTADVSILPF